MLAIDGTPQHSIFSGPDTSGSVTLSTSNSDDLIVVLVHCEQDDVGRQVASVSDTAGLTWNLRKRLTWHNTEDTEDVTHEAMEIWYAHAPAPLTSDEITVTLNGEPDDASICAFGVSGADVDFPWDANPTTPKTTVNATYTDIIPTVTGIDTTAADTMLLAFWGTSRFHFMRVQSPDFTEIANFNNGGGARFSVNVSAYKIVSSPQSGLSVAMEDATEGGENEWFQNGMIVDAIAAAGEGEAESETSEGDSESESESEGPGGPVALPVQCVAIEGG